MKNIFERYAEYQIRRLRKDEHVKSFNCGDKDLNDFILKESHHYRKALISVTYVYEHVINGEVIGSILLDFIKSYFIEDNKTGCRFITVDAYYNAIQFYQNNDFQYLKREEKDIVTRLLYYDLNDIA